MNAPTDAPLAEVEVAAPRLREIPYNYTSFSDREIVQRFARERSGVEHGEVGRWIERDRHRGAAGATQIRLDPTHELAAGRDRLLRERAQVELERFRFDDARRVGGNAEATDRGLGLAAPIEPAHLVGGPQVDPAKRKRAGEPERLARVGPRDRKE